MTDVTVSALRRCLAPGSGLGFQGSQPKNSARKQTNNSRLAPSVSRLSGRQPDNQPRCPRGSCSAASHMADAMHSFSTAGALLHSRDETEHRRNAYQDAGHPQIRQHAPWLVPGRAHTRVCVLWGGGRLETAGVSCVCSGLCALGSWAACRCLACPTVPKHLIGGPIQRNTKKQAASRPQLGNLANSYCARLSPLLTPAGQTRLSPNQPALFTARPHSLQGTPHTLACGGLNGQLPSLTAIQHTTWSPQN